MRENLAVMDSHGMEWPLLAGGLLQEEEGEEEETEQEQRVAHMASHRSWCGFVCKISIALFSI